jgi:hypothetical protein
MTDEEFRLLALRPPEATEQEHHGFPSWRVRGRIFATSPEPGSVNLMMGEVAIREAAAEFPAWCAERWWGGRLAALTVNLAAADAAIVVELVNQAWRNRAPAEVVRGHPEVG